MSNEQLINLIKNNPVIDQLNEALVKASSYSSAAYEKYFSLLNELTPEARGVGSVYNLVLTEVKTYQRIKALSVRERAELFMCNAFARVEPYGKIYQLSRGDS